jgi:hypothetical protein
MLTIGLILFILHLTSYLMTHYSQRYHPVWEFILHIMDFIFFLVMFAAVIIAVVTFIL